MSDEEIRDQNVMLEEMRGHIATLVDGHGDLVARLDETNGRLGRLEEKVDGIAGRVERIEHHLELNGRPTKKKRRK